MWERDNKKMSSIVKKCHSPYAACIYTAKKARKLQTESNNVINESTALQWAISDIPPKDLEKRQEIKRKKNHIDSSDRISQILESIDESYIRRAVLRSIQLSSKSHSLEYDYGEITNPEIKKRVRILTRMAFIN